MPTTEAARRLRQEAKAEAKHILEWWRTHMPSADGGFHGEIDADGRPVPDAPRSVILYTRMLWFFSAMATYLKSDKALGLAHRAAAYIRAHFVDPDHGGLYWLLDHRGQVTDAKKQGYAQAFGIYALAEYVRATDDAASLALARQLQRDVEERLWEPVHGGYVEAMSAYWRDAGDQRLSDKDADCPKTMNTHLHVLEAYTLLHRVAPDEVSNAALYRALDVFAGRFANGADGHLRLFFDIDWTDRTAAVSYGHDVEASWLMWEAAEVLHDRDMMARIRPLVLGLADATLRDGFNGRGGLSYERTFEGHLDRDGEWWGQAEGVIGFVNAWQMTAEPRYLDAAAGLWEYLKAQYKAGSGGEWTWYGADAVRPPVGLAGQWKCPYHNGRAMIELDHRLKKTKTA
ncbi:AGE family epimerase/isomerase [Asticcacaulis solisilvae]|uniref:AGE family epimerase/isomerase n=1 Tax=Asticcacaulis solisilvae TaxID=1217274 RepID=UPI003FD87CFD